MVCVEVSQIRVCAYQKNGGFLMVAVLRWAFLGLASEIWPTREIWYTPTPTTVIGEKGGGLVNAPVLWRSDRRRASATQRESPVTSKQSLGLSTNGSASF